MMKSNHYTVIDRIQMLKGHNRVVESNNYTAIDRIQRLKGRNRIVNHPDRIGSPYNRMGNELTKTLWASQKRRSRSHEY